MTLNRRQFLERTACTLVAAGFALSAAPAFAETVDVDALMQPGALSDMVLGDPNAGVTIVEYASMTCGHCANFHKNTYPHLKKEYIDTGKVRFVFREFPLDPVATAAFMLARCAPQEKYFDIVETMFHEQRSWAFTNDPYNSLLNFAKQVGFTQESFDTCLKNQELLNNVNAVRERASTEFGVNSTPTFFFNGTRVNGAITVDELEKALEPLL
ncbi:thioredoxin domain-containing protein [Stappia sp. F7233]|uniref:Thioredoxin domain-containing protein n=1 Tax=Stappia albiluteola TaxID=2758565 RepID=A0A839AHK9_9HYPH|nr:thioredoxin domain-containing protein [Stappia albiluteola]MBA5778414.1 thioredoxin domain-containing protein [Stappia albiluteola]